MRIIPGTFATEALADRLCLIKQMVNCITQHMPHKKPRACLLLGSICLFGCAPYAVSPGADIGEATSTLQSGRWEYARPEDQSRYNTYEKSWEYAGQDETLKYNTYQKRWEYAAPQAELKYNTYQKVWEYAPKDAELKYNIYEKIWQYAAPDETLKYNSHR